MVIVNKEIYKKIKMKLIDLDMTQAELASKIGVSKQMVNMVLRGIYETSKVREAIEQELNMEIWEKELK